MATAAQIAAAKAKALADAQAKSAATIAAAQAATKAAIEQARAGIPPPAPSQAVDVPVGMPMWQKLALAGLGLGAILLVVKKLKGRK